MNNKINKFIKTLSYIVSSSIFLWFLRIFISSLFLLSAFAKMYPSPEIGVIKFFEHKQLIDGLGFNEMFAQYFSRFLIAFEIFNPKLKPSLFNVFLRIVIDSCASFIISNNVFSFKLVISSYCL